MKSSSLKLFLAALIFVPAALTAQNRFQFYSELDHSRISTGILHDIAFPHAAIDAYDGSETARTASRQAWRQVYFELRNASLDKSQMPELNELIEKTRLLNRQKVFPIAIIDMDYEKICDDALEKNLITFDGERFREVQGANPYEIRNAFVAAVLSRRTHTSQVKFVLDEEFFFSNRPQEIDLFVIDFDDNAGTKQLRLGDEYLTTYHNNGEKTITLKAVYADGTEKMSAFTLNVKDALMPTPDIYIDDFTASIPYLNEAAQGNLAVFFGNGNTAITDPIIVVDGFDPGDTRPIEEIYELMNQENMAVDILGLGMDLIILNFYGGADYIQRNAFLFVELVNWVNDQMTTAGTMKIANQIAVIGPSMGGLISRYGTTYMESNNILHNIRTWISFDSPQKGANIPLGLQHWVRFFADEAGSEGAIEAKAALQSPAARQQLLYHFEKTSGTKANPHEWMQQLYDELDGLGFPEIRKISVINGSGHGQNQGFEPGDQVIHYYYYVAFLAEVRGHVWAVPNQINTKIFDGRYYVLGSSNVNQNIFVDNTLPLDGAPGGQTNVFEELAAIDPGYGDIIAYHDNCNFIPTISALALENTTDPYFNVHENLGSIVTPFDKIYYPAVNEDHNIITPDSYWWFFHEVYNYPPTFTSTPPVETVFHDNPFSYTMTATDQNEWNIISYEIVDAPDWLSINGSVLSGTPAFEDAGVHDVVVKVTDGLKYELQEFTIEVIPLYVFSGTGNWENPDHWNTPVLPESDSYVRIGGAAAITTEVTVANLTISDSWSLHIAAGAALSVSGELNNEAGVSGLVVESGGSLIQGSENVLARVERHIAAANWSVGNDGWHLISSPVDNQPVTGDWTPTGAGNDYDFYAWSEVQQTWLNQKIVSNGITHFIPGQGYLISYQMAGTKAFSGNINVADVQKSLTRTVATPHSGWNLLGNPFASALIWNNSSWENLEALNINSHAQIWNRIGKSYTIIAPGQVIPALNGFMVQLTEGASANLTIPAPARTHHDQPWYKEGEYQRIKLVAYENNDASFQESNIVINPVASEAFNAYHDARFLSGYAPLLYSLKGQEQLAVFSTPALHNELVVPFGFEKNNASSFRIELEESIDGATLYLFDKKLGLEHQLSFENPYGFTAEAGDSPMRFELRFSPTDVTSATSIGESLVHIFIWENNLYLNFAKEAPGRLLQIFDLSGRLVLSHKLDHGLNHTRRLNVEPGVYIVRVSSPRGFSTQMVFVK